MLRFEADLIKRWAELLQERRVDITLTYNGFGFDDQYMYRRLEML